MSGYEAYPEYRDSGVEEIGKIPSEWTVCRLKHMASINNGADYKQIEMDEGYPVMGSGGRFAYASDFMYDKPSVLLGRKGTIDRPLYVTEPFWSVDTMYYTEIFEDVPPKYLYYCALTIQFSKYTTNTALPSMTQESIGDYRFAVPKTSPERLQIANFLDHETAKIDTLIEKQQQLIKLLKEKRQAVISHAVTKGLNPDAPMKDSGVEWLGEVPEGWEVGRLSHYATVGNGATPNRDTAAYWENGTIPWLTSTVVNDRKVRNSDQFISSTALRDTAVKNVFAGDLLMAITGEGRTRGMVAICDMEATINQHLVSISFDKEFISTEYLYFQLFSRYDRLRFESGGSGGTRAAITCEDIKNYPVLLPDIREQLKIAMFLVKKSTLFDSILVKILDNVELLQERRTALISAAVTGKIDVRNWQPPADTSPSSMDA